MKISFHKKVCIELYLSPFYVLLLFIQNKKKKYTNIKKYIKFILYEKINVKKQKLNKKKLTFYSKRFESVIFLLPFAIAAADAVF